MLFTFVPALRRAMRRHQGLPARSSGLPMWRLLGGELLWAIRQVIAAPWVLAGLVVGSVGTLLVLDSGAPGPVAELPMRVLLAVVVGWLLAAGGRAISDRDASSRATGDDRSEVRPLAAATILAAAIAAVALLMWLLVWLVTSVA